MFWIFRLTEVYLLFLRSAGEFIKFRVFNGFIALLNHKKHKDHPWFQCSLAVLLTLRNICHKYSRVKCKWSHLALGQSKKCHPKDEKESNGAVNMRADIINATVVTLIPSISWPRHCPFSALLPKGSSKLYPEAIRAHASLLNEAHGQK